MLNTSCLCVNCILSYFVSFAFADFSLADVFLLFLQSFCFLDRSIITLFCLSWQISYKDSDLWINLLYLGFDLFTHWFHCSKSKHSWKQLFVSLNFSTYSSIFIRENVCWQIFYAIKGEENEMQRKVST